MSFNFTWPVFSPEFHDDARAMLDSALNRGPKPKVIADDIKVDELSMGTMPPDLEILEIGDLSRDRFRGIFRLTYAGDAHLVLSTRVQANPLSKPMPSSSTSSGRGPSSAQEEDTFTPFASAGSSSRGILFAAAPLIVPMQLRLSHVRLRAIIVLVVSKTKGITLVFKNDPLESVQVSSTFDSVAVIAKYLQQEIESQLKEVFREDLPGIIHRLSQQWLTGQTKRKTGTENAMDKPTQPKGSSYEHGLEQTVVDSSRSPPKHARKKSLSSRKGSSAVGDALSSPTAPNKKRYSQAGSSKGSRPVLPSAPSISAVPIKTRPSDDDEDSSFEIPPPLGSSFDDAESYDPTYGLRPDEVRLPKDGKGFRGLKGLRKSGGAIGGRQSVGLGGLLQDMQASHHKASSQEDSESDAETDEVEHAEPDGAESEWAEEDGLEEELDELNGAFLGQSDGEDRSRDQRRDQARRSSLRDLADVSPGDDDSPNLSSSSAEDDYHSKTGGASSTFNPFGANIPKRNRSVHSSTSYQNSSASGRIGAGVGLSGSEIGFGYLPMSASVLGAATDKIRVNKVSASTSSPQRMSLPAGTKTLPASSSYQALPSESPLVGPGLSRSQSSAGLSSSRPRAPPLRPRIFHSSSLIRPIDPAAYGGDGADVSADDGSFSRAASTWAGSVRGSRTDSAGGGEATVYSGSRGIAGTRSGPGSSRTFTLRRGDSQTGSKPERSPMSGTG